MDQARSACADVRLAVSQGIDPHAEKRKNITFAELFTDVYTPVAERKRSWKDDVQKFERWLRNRFGSMLVSSVTSGRIAEFLKMLEEKEKLAPATINRYRALLSAMFRVAIDEGRRAFSAAVVRPCLVHFRSGCGLAGPMSGGPMPRQYLVGLVVGRAGSICTPCTLIDMGVYRIGTQARHSRWSSLCSLSGCTRLVRAHGCTRRSLNESRNPPILHLMMVRNLTPLPSENIE